MAEVKKYRKTAECYKLLGYLCGGFDEEKSVEQWGWGFPKVYTLVDHVLIQE
jgi:hypothetical protein